MELFETTGQVELAEILFDGTRSKGCGVVQFAQVTEAETAIGSQLPSFLGDPGSDPFSLQPNSNNICTADDLWVCPSVFSNSITPDPSCRCSVQ